MKKNFGVFKLIILCFIVVVVSAIPTIGIINYNNELENIVNHQTNAFECILNVWNVDTFEGGSASKTEVLEGAGMKFSKENQGTYFLIKNLTADEAVNNLQSGIYPDIISFGAGVGSFVLPYLENLNNLNVGSVRPEILNSGKIDENLYAVGYLMGGLILATTEEKLVNAGKNIDVNLLEVVNNCGYDKKTKNGVSHTSSVVLGKNKNINMIDAFFNASGMVLSDVYASESPYDAYQDFVSYNKGTILLGTHRDLFKLSGRIAVGKISGVKIEYLEGYTNLIQYVGVIKDLNVEKMEIAKKYIEYLTTHNVQNLSSKIGMVNTIGENFYEDGEFLRLEEALNKPIKVPKLF